MTGRGKRKTTSSRRKFSDKDLARLAGVQRNPELMLVLANKDGASGKRMQVRKSDLPKALGRYWGKPKFMQALRLYVKFHGCLPRSIKKYTVPFGTNRETDFAVALGDAPADSYSARNPRSRKKGKIYVHPYKNRPMRIVDRTGKVLMTTPGTHRVTDWIRG